MAFRIATFFLLLSAGGVAGFQAWGHVGADIGVALAAGAWFLFDLLRGLRVTRWLRRGDAVEPPRMGGLWGEVGDRARRALRKRDQERMQAEDRLQAFLAAIQASPNGVVLLDAAGHIEWCNQTAAEHLGFDVARDHMQLVGNLVRDPGFTAYYAGNDYSGDVVVPGRGSTASRSRRISIQLHPYGEGRRLLLSRDVTALEQAETMRRDFVANVSHEIRTPLTVLSGFVETLQTLPLDEAERLRYLGMMSQQAHRMQSLVNDLLTLSRLEGSPAPGMTEWVALEQIMAQCESEARGLTETLGKHQELLFGPVPAVSVAVSQTELVSAMSNLVSNAIRYTPARKAIDIGWHLLPDGGVQFRVHDAGLGIAPEHIPRLTERFYRVDRSRSRETGGTGLGLAIVKHVAQRHGGELRIVSTVGDGSTFALLLPAARGHQAS